MQEISGTLSELLVNNPNTLEKLAIDIPFYFSLSLGAVYFSKVMCMAADKLEKYFSGRANSGYQQPKH